MKAFGNVMTTIHHITATIIMGENIIRRKAALNRALLIKAISLAVLLKEGALVRALERDLVEDLVGNVSTI